VLQEVIRRVPFFSTLPARHARWLAETLQAQDLLDGALLFSEGERGDIFYIVIQGEIELFKRLEDGGEQIIAVRGPGEYIGEMSLLHPEGRRMASARARGDGEVLIISRQDFDALLNRYPPLGYQLARVLGDRLDQAHSSSIHRLEERNRELQAALDQLHAAQAELIETRKLEHELALAREIQLSLLPTTLPLIPGYDFGARLLPMMQVGGDFYDFIALDSTHLGVAVGDVSGHGVPAALIMAITVALLRSEACRGCSPADVLTAVNGHLFKLGAHRMFVTALYGALEISTGEFTYARAGHEPLLLTHHEDDTPCFHLGGEGRLLGLFDQVSLNNATLTLKPGASLVLYTDGVIEARSRDRDFFGEERLSQLAFENRNMPAQALCDSIIAGVAAHSGEPAQADDITVVSVRKA
jgi:sigma-B regulation protein RsbU (phosphoserine phosphatase)